MTAKAANKEPTPRNPRNEGKIDFMEFVTHYAYRPLLANYI
jgi:hypothetical protein